MGEMLSVLVGLCESWRVIIKKYLGAAVRVTGRTMKAWQGCKTKMEVSERDVRGLGVRRAAGKDRTRVGLKRS